MTEEKPCRYCDDETKCQNAGVDCEHCTRSYYYEESSDCFVEKPSEG